MEPTYDSMSGQYIGSKGPVDPALEAANQAMRRRRREMSTRLAAIASDWPTPTTN